MGQIDEKIINFMVALAPIIQSDYKHLTVLNDSIAGYQHALQLLNYYPPYAV